MACDSNAIVPAMVLRNVNQIGDFKVSRDAELLAVCGIRNGVKIELALVSCARRALGSMR